MKSIFISGMAGSGKTAIALGLALKLREAGINVGYFKPLGTAKGPHRQEDEDVLLFQDVLSLKHEASLLCPVRTGPYYLSGGPHRDPDKSAAVIKEAYATVSDGLDLVLIDGSLSPYTAASLGLDAISLSKMLQAAMIHVIRMEDDYSLDKAIYYNEHFRLAGLNLLGSIFNNIERTLLDKTKGVYAPIMEKLGLPILGIIPRKAEIAAPTVLEFYDALGGELLTGEEVGMNRMVEEVVVGSMTIESALGYLRRAPNKAVITGGDRSDMAVTALETSTSVLILTGGLYPDVGVLTRAIEKNVPVILVHYDTYTAIERLHVVSRRIRPGDEDGIKVAKDNVSAHCNVQPIINFVEQ
ncbi:MAG: phosphotransacetylase family protein [Bacillota bacterium]|nr:phosphotransacetylase family protein [Bacillota bacterium]MDW7683937.1 phosphotransacetylase family protein [Bacillota bacterium]